MSRTDDKSPNILSNKECGYNYIRVETTEWILKLHSLKYANYTKPNKLKQWNIKNIYKVENDP